jgi:two-component system, sensor histidine kinase and response regulator
MSTIIIAEDDGFLSRALQHKLEKEGFTVIAATKGDAVNDIVENQQPSMVLLDVLMPGKNGFEVLADLKRNDQTKNIPVMMLSNLGQESDTKKGMELGAIGYLIKSDTPLATLVTQIKEHLAKH